MSQVSRWLNDNWFMLILLGVLVCMIVVILVIADNGKHDIQKAIDSEQKDLDSVKNNCGDLGNWLIKYSHNPLDLDPVINEANKIYEVKCR